MATNREAPTGGIPGPVPKDWLPGLAENWKSDVVSGAIIFLIALPLSLGIALASGAPPIAGIITAIIGGMLVSLLSGSHVTINGPAAGLIVIVLGAIEALGAGDPIAGYRYALAVGVACGIIQIALGLLRAGAMTSFFPLSVVHGMLAGIGVIIMFRQIHVALGATPEFHIDFPLFHGLNPILSVPGSVAHFNPYVTIIGIVSMLIMLTWPSLKKVAKLIPAPLVAAVAGVVLAIVFGLGVERTYSALGREAQLGPRLLLDLPEGGLLGGLTSPDFGKIFTMTSIRWIVAYVFVASLESLLTAAAIDKMDPWKRRSNMNREFVGKGIGNALSSMVGGLPMIAEVVRSSANVFNGARTRWSNFVHGLFILLFVMFLPSVLEMIPLAALAGILVIIGWRLAHPRQFVEAGRIGKEELALMLVTIILVVIEDLLVGVAAGVIVGLAIALARGTSIGNLFKPRVAVMEDPATGRTTLKFSGALGFGNFIGVRGRLDKLAKGKTVVLDFTDCKFIDHTVVERLHDFEEEYLREGGHVEKIGFEGLVRTTDHPFSARKRVATPTYAAA